MKTAPSPILRVLDSIGGLSRQGVIATSRWVRSPSVPSGPQRALWLLPSSMMIGIGVACLAAAGLGVAPFDVALSAIDTRTPLSFGQAAWALMSALFLISTLLGVRPTARSLSFMLLNGLSIDVARQIIVAPDPIVTRIGLAFVGATVLVLGVATVVHQAAAGGAFESIMTAAERKGRNPMRVRTGLEVLFLVVGVLAGGAFGPMTVVLALMLGPAIRIGLQAWEDMEVGRAERRRSTSRSSQRRERNFA